MPVPAEHLDRLIQRRDYLTLRVEIKSRMGWENLYDRAERDALTWALGELTYRAAQDQDALRAENHR